MAFQFIMPGQVFMGKNALQASTSTLARLGSKALIVTDPAMVQLGNTKLLTEVLDTISKSYVIFSDITGEPTDSMVEKGLKIFEEEKCDFLIAVGGGSTIDSMKAIAMLAANGGNIDEYMGKSIEKETAPMVAIPTTAGTGSEATQVTVITNTKKDIKMMLRSSVLMPDVAIADPAFTMTAPPKITASTGLDALTRAIVAYTSKRANKLSDSYALSAAKRIFKNLPVCFHDGSNGEAREEMALAAFEAGVAFNNSSVTVVHGMSRPIGALFHVPHGMANAMLLKECLSYVADGTFERFGQLGREVGAAHHDDDDVTATRKLIEKVDWLCRELQVPTLKEYGIDQTVFERHMEKMAEDALMSGSPSNTRKPLGKEDIMKMYKNLWK